MPLNAEEVGLYSLGASKDLKRERCDQRINQEDESGSRYMIISQWRARDRRPVRRLITVQTRSLPELKEVS